MPEPDTRRTDVRVWDLPTRLFHWALAACVLGSVVSAKLGGNAMDWHFRFGYAIFTLLLFRLVWGLVGGRWSRFSSFVYAPSTLWRYLCGRTDARLEVGHSPLGALSVFALLALLIAQVATGLVADDEIFHRGPLNPLVSGASALQATGWHAGWGQWLVLGLVGLHLAAIAAYTAAGRALVGAMVGGDKALPPATPASRDDARTRALALALLAACAGVVAWVISLGG